MKRLKVTLLMGIAAMALAMLAGCGKPTIKLNDFIVVKTSGYDGYGKANISIDWDEIDDMYSSKTSFTKLAKEEYEDDLDDITSIELLSEFVTVKVNDTTNLKNGQDLHYKISVKDKYSEYLNCKVEYENGDVTIDDLTPLEKFNAFADLNVFFDGIAPNGTLSYEYTGSYLGPYGFSFDKTYGLSNGDIVTVTLPESVIDECIANHGKVPDALSETFKIEGLAYYATGKADIPTDTLENMKKDAEDILLSYIAINYADSSKISDIAYEGYVFGTIDTSKKYYFISYYNEVYIILSGTVSSTEGNFATTKVYFPIRFYNVLVEDTTTYVYDTYIRGYSRLPASSYYTYGYINPHDAYNDITSNKYDYIMGCGDGFEKYAESTIVDELSDVTDELRDCLFEMAKDEIYGNYNRWFPSTTTLENLGLLGAYMLKIKNPDSYSYNGYNRYFMVCAATLTDSNNMFEDMTVYFPIEFREIEIVAGEYFVETIRNASVYYTIPNTWYGIYGYVDGTKMYNDIVTSNRDNYIYEVTDELKQFGE